MLLSLCLTFIADEALTVEKRAQITHEQQQAQREVNAKYGNKKSSELSADERKQMIKDSVAADRAVLERNAVDAKQLARQNTQQGRQGAAQQQRLQKELVEKERLAAEAAKKAQVSKDVQVQKGFSDENPVTLDEQVEDGKVGVERGLPPELEADQAAAAEQDRLENSGPADEGGKAGRRQK